MSTVLQIDDDAASRRLLERILLRRPSVRLVTADGGRDGLRLAAEELPDLVISDLRLPDLSGLEVLVALKAEPTLCHIPVVIVSGEARAERIEELMQAGAAEYLTKPFSFVRLLEIVDRYVVGCEPPEALEDSPDASSRGAVPGSGSGPLAVAPLAQLHRLHGRLPAGDPLIGDFLVDADRLIAALAAGIASGDHDGAERLAHNLSGSSGMFAADAVSHLATRVEHHLAAGQQEAAEALLGELRNEMDRAAEALRREFPVT